MCFRGNRGSFAELPQPKCTGQPRCTQTKKKKYFPKENRKTVKKKKKAISQGGLRAGQKETE